MCLAGPRTSDDLQIVVNRLNRTNLGGCVFHKISLRQSIFVVVYKRWSPRSRRWTNHVRQHRKGNLAHVDSVHENSSLESLSFLIVGFNSPSARENYQLGFFRPGGGPDPRDLATKFRYAVHARKDPPPRSLFEDNFM